jgi:hypothetical protein
VPAVLLPVTDALWTENNKVGITFVSWTIAGLYYLIVLAGALPFMKRLQRLETNQLNREDGIDDVA